MIIIIIYHYIPSYSTTRYCSSSNSTIFVVDHIIRCDYSCDWVLGEPGPRKLDWLPWEPFEYWHSDGERLLDPIAGGTPLDLVWNTRGVHLWAPWDPVMRKKSGRLRKMEQGLVTVCFDFEMDLAQSQQVSVKQV